MAETSHIQLHSDVSLGLGLEAKICVLGHEGCDLEA